VTCKEYVLITPARNEEANIERTAEAVLAQTILPQKWVVVSDGSVDRTEEIVARYAERHGFIRLLSAPKQGQKGFASKVRAFQAGYDQLKDTPYSFLGNLDADVSFGSDYYERILDKFQADPALGMAGGIILERIGDQFVPQRISSNSVAGAVQLFRRECFEAIGGYIPIQTGGIDAVAEIMARMHGWRVRTFSEVPVYHHRRVSTGKASILSTRFHHGVTNYLLGYHPLFQLLSCLYRIFDRPYLIGSALALLGYGWSHVRGYPRAIPDEVIHFLRAEQRARMTLFFAGRKAVGDN